MASETVFRTPKRKLAEYFNSCFMLILQLQAAQNFGEPEVLRRRIKEFLEKIERNCAQAGYHGDLIKSAMFAAVAFIDETIISSQWHAQNVWRENPLQLELYKTFNAGVEFFDHLEQLLKRPGPNGEVLEIYYLCMVLGFKGQYFLHNQDKLRILIDDTFKELSRSSDAPYRELSPHGAPPNGQREKQPHPMGRIDIPAWVYYVAIVTMGVLFYLALNVSITVFAKGLIQNINDIMASTQI